MLALRPVAFAAIVSALAPAQAAQAWSAAGDWVVGSNSRVRLIAAPVTGADGAQTLVAGVEIALDPGWKTYWRYPGDTGGMPPEFDWKASANLGAAKVLFPAPAKLVDSEGDSIGYLHSVLFPVALTATDPAKPVMLDLAVAFGVCKNICIPEERELKLTLDPSKDSDPAVSDKLKRALAEVPVLGKPPADAPKFDGMKVDASSGPAQLVLDTTYPKGTADPEVFVETLDSSYVPQPVRLADSGDGHVRFRIDLAKSEFAKQPSGKTLRLTLVGDDASSEATAAIP